MKGLKYILPSITVRGIGVGLLILMMAACSNDALDEGTSVDNAVANSLLQVRTRGTAEEATIAYPVQVFVFKGDECTAVQTIGGAGQTLNIALTEWMYSVYAVGGASSTDYTLPAKNDATATSSIALKEGRALTDLMAASATATLVDGGTNTVTLGLQRKTMLIQDVTIKQIPTAATAVSVTFAPLWQSLTIGGTYSTANSSTTIALTKQEDNRTWKLPAPVGEGPGVGSVFTLLPSSQPASVSVNVTIGGATKTYTYSCSDQLEAGYKINIDGTYTEAVGVSLTGTITGATWLGERTISFDFDENGSTTAGGGGDNGGGENTDPTPDPSPTGAGSIPTVGSLHQTCYVLAVSDQGDHADVTLLSPNEATIGDSYYNITSATTTAEAQTAAVQAAVDAKIAASDVDAVSDWRLPTYAELNAIYAASEAINAAFDTDISTGEKYLYDDSGTVKQRVLSAITGEGTHIFGATARVRPVVTVSIAKE